MLGLILRVAVAVVIARKYNSVAFSITEFGKIVLIVILLSGAGLFLLPGVLWLAVKGVLPNGAKPDKINSYKK